MRLKLLASAAFVSSILLPAYAQNSANDSTTPLFKSRAELVVVPVLVTKDGKHVAGLTKEDFTVLQDGKPQTVVHFEEIKTERPTSGLISLPWRDSQEFSNIGSQGAAHFTIVVLDHMTFDNATYGKRALLEYLKNNLDAREPTALVAMTSYGPKVVHDFTDHLEVLTAALEKLTLKSDVSRPSATGDTTSQRPSDPVVQQENSPAAIDQQMKNLTAMLQELEGNFDNANIAWITASENEWLRNLARSYAGVPGRKSLIWIGERVPLTPTKVDEDQLQWGGSRYIYSELIQELQGANISVYPVNARGLMAPTGGGTTAALYGSGYKGSVSGSGLDPDVQDMRELAEVSGGRAFVNSNDLAGSIASATRDSQAYYQLSYSLKPDSKPGWHKLSVKVNQQHVEVRARNKFFSGPTPGHKQEDELTHILRSPLTMTGVPITVRWTESRVQSSDKSKKAVGFRVSISGQGITLDDRDGNHLSLSLIVSLRDTEGKELQKMSREMEARLKSEDLETFLQKGLHFNSGLMLAPGDYIAKFLVRDNLGGQIGTLTAPLTVKE